MTAFPHTVAPPCRPQPVPISLSAQGSPVQGSLTPSACLPQPHVPAPPPPLPLPASTTVQVLFRPKWWRHVLHTLPPVHPTLPHQFIPRRLLVSSEVLISDRASFCVSTN